MPKIHCPHCSQHIDADESFAGSVVECPTCGGQMKIPEATAPTPAPMHAPAQARLPIYAPPPQQYTQRPAQNPYRPPHAPLVLQEPRGPRRYYGGLRRLSYILVSMGMGVVTFILFLLYAIMRRNALTQETEGHGSIPVASAVTLGEVILVLGILVCLSLIPMALRLKNIGWTPMLCLASFVPVVGFFLGVLCLILPEGYADTKKLDTAAKVILGVIVFLIGLIVVFGIMSGAFHSSR